METLLSLRLCSDFDPFTLATSSGLCQSLLGLEDLLLAEGTAPSPGKAGRRKEEKVQFVA